jgi:hypothetical protein
MSDLDPNLRRTHRSESSGGGMWAGILLAAFVVVVGLILLLPKGTDTTATAPGSPPATTGSGTSGSGTNTPSR